MGVLSPLGLVGNTFSICCSTGANLLAFLRAVITTVLHLAPFTGGYSFRNVTNDARSPESSAVAFPSSRNWSVCSSCPIQHLTHSVSNCCWSVCVGSLNLFSSVKPVDLFGPTSCILFCLAYVKILAYLEWKARPVVHEQVHFARTNSNTTGLCLALHNVPYFVLTLCNNQLHHLFHIINFVRCELNYKLCQHQQMDYFTYCLF